MRFRRWNTAAACAFEHAKLSLNYPPMGPIMDSIIYLVGLIVIIMFILSALGLR
jgi:hypothetical protein